MRSIGMQLNTSTFSFPLTRDPLPGTEGGMGTSDGEVEWGGEGKHTISVDSLCERIHFVCLLFNLLIAMKN